MKKVKIIKKLKTGDKVQGVSVGTRPYQERVTPTPYMSDKDKQIQELRRQEANTPPLGHKTQWNERAQWVRNNISNQPFPLNILGYPAVALANLSQPSKYFEGKTGYDAFAGAGEMATDASILAGYAGGIGKGLKGRTKPQNYPSTPWRAPGGRKFSPLPAKNPTGMPTITEVPELTKEQQILQGHGANPHSNNDFKITYANGLTEEDMRFIEDKGKRSKTHIQHQKSFVAPSVFGKNEGFRPFIDNDNVRKLSEYPDFNNPSPLLDRLDLSEFAPSSKQFKSLFLEEGKHTDGALRGWLNQEYPEQYNKFPSGRENFPESLVPTVRQQNKYGGKTPKADPGIKVKKQNPPIYVSDPKDPRLQAYNDSLNLHNGYERILESMTKKGWAKSHLTFDDYREGTDGNDYSGIVHDPSFRKIPFSKINPYEYFAFDDTSGVYPRYKGPVQPVKLGVGKIDKLSVGQQSQPYQPQQVQVPSYTPVIRPDGWYSNNQNVPIDAPDEQIQGMYNEDGTRKYQNGGTMRKVKIMQVPHANNGLNVLWGGKAEQISDNPYDGGTVMFKGNTHEQTDSNTGETGIGVNYGPDNVVEVQNNEPATVSQDGSLNVWGAMNIPGSNKTFQQFGKKIASIENKTTKKKENADKLMEESDPTNRYELLTFNSGRVQSKSADTTLKALATKKEEVTRAQENILTLANTFGINPKKFSEKIKDIPMEHFTYVPENNQRIQPTQFKDGGKVDWNQLKQELADIESTGGDYKAYNKGSHAMGKYQFTRAAYWPAIKNVTGVKTEQEFLNSPEKQEQFFDYYSKNIIPDALSRMRGFNKAGYSDADLIKIFHFQGEPNGTKFLKTGRDETPGVKEGKNVSIKRYLDVNRNKIASRLQDIRKAVGNPGTENNQNLASAPQQVLQTETPAQAVAAYRQQIGTSPEKVWGMLNPIDVPLYKPFTGQPQQKQPYVDNTQYQYDFADGPRPISRKDADPNYHESRRYMDYGDAPTGPGEMQGIAKDNIPQLEYITPDNGANPPGTQNMAQVNTPGYTPKFDAEKQPVGKTTPANPLVSNTQNQTGKKTSMADNAKLKLTDVLPEILTFLQKPDPVDHFRAQAQYFNSYQISNQDQLNANKETFAAFNKLGYQNPSAQAAIASQKYNADSNVLGNQFRMNQEITADTANKNIAMHNAVLEKNLELSRDQSQKKAGALANTRMARNAALTSIGNKIQEAKQAKMNYKAIEANRRFALDKQGNSVMSGNMQPWLFNNPMVTGRDPVVAANFKATKSTVPVTSTDAYGQPINYYGQPLDANGNPIPPQTDVSKYGTKTFWGHKLTQKKKSN